MKHHAQRGRISETTKVLKKASLIQLSVCSCVSIYLYLRKYAKFELSHTYPGRHWIPPAKYASDWLVITTVCVDEGDKLAPDGQENAVKNYMHHTMSNHAAYARKHGYPYIPLTRAFSELSSKDVRYHKLGWVRQLLSNFTWVFYTDCDSLFIDFCVDIAQWPKEVENSPGGHDVALILTGDRKWAMNSGQFFMRNVLWSHRLLKQAALQPRNTHGCVGNDNAAFNWLLWLDCNITHGDFTTWWNDTSKCQRMVKNSIHATKLACAPMNTYPQHVSEAKRRGPLFRVHFAGSQSQKLRLVEKYLQLVQYAEDCACSDIECI